jgi:hypothetical protein
MFISDGELSDFGKTGRHWDSNKVGDWDTYRCRWNRKLPLDWHLEIEYETEMISLVLILHRSGLLSVYSAVLYSRYHLNTVHMAHQVIIITVFIMDNSRQCLSRQDRDFAITKVHYYFFCIIQVIPSCVSPHLLLRQILWLHSKPVRLNSPQMRRQPSQKITKHTDMQHTVSPIA